MAIVGFSFLKINAERHLISNAGSIEINHNISIKKTEKTHLNIGGNKNDVLRIEFEFTVKYGNELGSLLLDGDIIYTDTPEIISETLKTWEADQKLPKMVNEEIFKFIYNKAIVKSLELSDSLGLPSPIPMPNISFSKPEDK